jgi:hypothetical protein
MSRASCILRPVEDQDPTLARLRKILDLVQGLSLGIESDTRFSDDRWEVEKMLQEALRVAERKHHLIRKLRRALRAKDRRARKLAERRAG